jgi:hypothetical protein
VRMRRMGQGHVSGTDRAGLGGAPPAVLA